MALTALSVNGVSKLFGDKLALNSLSFETVYGEIIGILGPTGSGKSTLLRIIGGAVMPDEGDVLVNGVSLYRDYEACMSIMGVALDNAGFYEYLSGYDNLRIIGSLYGCSGKRIEDTVRLLKLDDVINSKVSEYPAGSRKLLSIAAAMLGNPKILAIDEALDGLDPVTIVDLRRLFKKLTREKGMCVIVASQQMNQLERMCDRVALIDFGVLLGVGSVTGLRAISSSRTRQRMRVDRPDEAARLINDALGYGVEVRGEDVLVETEQNNVPKLVNLLYQSGFFVYEIQQQEMALEEAYYHMLRQRPKPMTDEQLQYYAEGRG